MAKKKSNNKKNDNTNIEEIIEEIENTKEFKKNKVSTETVEKSIKETNNKKWTRKKENSIFTNIILSLILVIGLIYFFSSLVTGSINNLSGIISLLSMILFTISFVVVGISLSMNKKKLFLIGALCLGIFYINNLFSIFNIINIDSSVEVEDFRDRTLTEVMKWASKNKVEINQEYEYSDMISENKIISQSSPVGTKIKDITNFTLSVSEGPNPSKEIIIPNMISWDTERVIKFVSDNYLSNVNVEFRESGEAVDTVIEQDKIGNVKRDEEINLVFSLGEEVNYDKQFKLIDFTNKTKFEAVLYLKQHHMGYAIEEGYSDSIKKGYMMAQSIKAGEMVKVNDWINLTISKGPEIKVPDLTKMSTTELTNWIIENKLKVKFSDKYDSNVKKNGIISVNYKNEDKISQGTVVEVVLSKGPLKMSKFKSLDQFKDWADKYNVKFEEQHEFSSTVKAGEVISYSLNKGDTIKNDDVIIIKVSDGEKITVPDLEGLTKKEIETKLKKLGLNYYFIYKSSNNISEGKAFKQSISAGSEVSDGTTITITISSGKETTSSSSSSSSNYNSSTNNNSSNTQNREEVTCEVKTCTIGSSINNIKNNTTGYDYTASEISKIMNSQCPGVSYKLVASTDSGMSAGSIVSGIKPGSKFDTCTSSPYTIVIAR